MAGLFFIVNSWLPRSRLAVNVPTEAGINSFSLVAKLGPVYYK